MSANNAGTPNPPTKKIVTRLIGTTRLKEDAIKLYPYNRKELSINFLTKIKTFFILSPLLYHMMTRRHYDNFFRSFKALSKVSASIYSISAPIGIPLAKRDIVISKPSRIFLIYKAVVSPSMLGLKASITS